MRLPPKQDGSWTGHDAVRHFMYEKMEATFQGIAWEEKTYDLMEFGCREPTSAVIRMLDGILADRLQPQSCEYPEVDIMQTPYPDERWDISVADQVLEHVRLPWIAADELYRITKMGGLCVVATPFLHPIHNCPNDYWRFAPDGYRVLFPEDKWDYITLDMWGRREAIQNLYASPMSRGMTGEWIPMNQAVDHIGRTGFVPETDGLHPIVVWWIGRKK